MCLFAIPAADEMMTEEQHEIIESSAEMLYGLIHARYILTSRGMNAVVRAPCFLWSFMNVTKPVSLLSRRDTCFFFLFNTRDTFADDLHRTTAG